MNQPFPTALQRRSETAIDRLLAEQTADTALFVVAVRHLETLIDGLHFPLGSPAHRYDLSDITATLSDWLIARDPDHLQEYAEDAVITLLAGGVVWAELPTSSSTVIAVSRGWSRSTSRAPARRAPATPAWPRPSARRHPRPSRGGPRHERHPG